jgi:DNA-binding protein HU-beta
VALAGGVMHERGPVMAKRTTLRSSKGTKLYAVRDKSGKFKDIQTYKRAHSADMRHKSKAETAAKKKSKSKSKSA